MAKRKQYPLRIDSEVWAGIERWAADDLRSVNAQVEFILRRALKDAGRLKDEGGRQPGHPGRTGDEEAGPGGLRRGGAGRGARRPAGAPTPPRGWVPPAASVRSGRKGEGGYASTSSRSTTSSSFSRAGAREESCSEPCTRPSFVLSSLRLRSARTGLGWSSMR